MGNGDRRHPRRDADAFDGADEFAEYDDDRYYEDEPPARGAGSRGRRRSRPRDDYAAGDWERSDAVDEAWADDDAFDGEIASGQQNALEPLPERNLVRETDEADGALPIPFHAQDTGPFIIPGSGESMGIGFIPRRERPLAMRLAVFVMIGLIVFSGLYAFAPMGAGEGAQAQSESPFQALAGAVVWHMTEGYTLYTARSGDSVEGLAARFHVQIGGIYELNSMLSGQDLQLGKTYKIPVDPDYGLYYVPPSFILQGYGTTTYTNNPWTSMAGIPPDGALCGPPPQGQGDNMGSYDLLSFKLYGPNPNSYWVRGFIPNYHFGVDISQPAGAPIHAAQAGEVIFSGWDPGGGGWTVKINNCHHLSTMYCHMEAPPIVTVHQMVVAGAVLGYEGATGDATGPHLHYQVEWDNVPVDPTLFYVSSGIGSITRCGAAPSC